MYEQLNIPQKGKIDNTIYKKIFIENAELSKADKKILSEVIHKIVWRYSLKEETCYIRQMCIRDRSWEDRSLRCM